MSEQQSAIKAKIPGAQTRISVKQSLCDICTPGPQCGLDVYVKDGKIIKVEGIAGYPGSNGKLCTKGASTRQYVYRQDRLQTPMRRVGERGSGQFEPISWQEAYQFIADKLNKIKREVGPQAVAWYCGYPKWLRPWLHRLTYSFGSQNFGTESSCCYQATVMAWKSVTGQHHTFDMAQANVYMGWGCNSYLSNHIHARNLMRFKERGGTIIIIDPRVTPTTEKLADIHLQIHPGTDGALAMGLANIIIENGWYDAEFVAQHIHGFDEYKAQIEPYTLTETARITGVTEHAIYQVAKIYAKQGPVAMHETSATINHHINGFNNYRAMIALQAITGNIDKAGGSLPVNVTFIYHDGGFEMKQEEFINSQKPQNPPEKIGGGKFPLWNELVDQFQAMDLARCINESDPYPLKAVIGFGLNHRMFPQPEAVLIALKKLDLVVVADIAMTDACKIADIILPSCTSLERSELKVYPGGFLTCTTPTIEPLYQSKADTEIICELANYLDIDDDLLKSGYENTLRYMISDLPLTLEELKAAPLPLKVPSFSPYKPGSEREEGFKTPTGKIELYSETIKRLQPKQPEFSPLPVYKPSNTEDDRQQFPLTLIVGARLGNAIHSRFHEIPWARSLRPDAAADIHPEDAHKLGIHEGDDIELSTEHGAIYVKAHLTYSSLPGDVYMYHGYKEADANALVGISYLDPYSGFPGFRQVNCAVKRMEVA